MDKLDPKRCVESVRSVGMWHSYQCSNSVKVTRDGKGYCGTHDPVKVEERREKQRLAHDQNSCRECGYHFHHRWYRFCPLCGLGKGQVKVKK